MNGPNPWDIQIHDARVWARVLRDRELGLGEAYMDGWWSARSVDQFLTRILTADVRGQVRANPRILALSAASMVTNRQTKRRAAVNASAHYDIGNDLFEAMLDKRMIYSCGYWRHAEDLDSAQEDKLDLICQKLHLQPGMRVLDIGCGWGGFACYAAERYGAHVTGISPAIEQVTLARERCHDLPVQIRRQDYRQVSGTFDRILSVGMMEHVGPKNLGVFFEHCGQLLHPDGIMLHHFIGSNASTARTDAWFDKYVFPGGVLPSMAQLGRAAGADWVFEDVHNFGPDYDRTLMAWYRKIESSWGDLDGYDEAFKRRWRYYLLASAASFRTRNVQLWQVVFTRSDRVSSVYQTAR